MPREEALGEFIRQQLRPLSARDEVSRFIHLFYWETVHPTVVYRKLVSEEATPFVGFAVDLMRRFMPKADQRTLIVAAVWLMGQCSVFVRHREQLADPPVSLVADEAAIEWLTTLISSWALAGLAQAPPSSTLPAASNQRQRCLAGSRAFIRAIRCFGRCDRRAQHAKG